MACPMAFPPRQGATSPARICELTLCFTDRTGLFAPLSLNYFAVRQMTKRAVEMLYVRGDGVILVSPPLRTS